MITFNGYQLMYLVSLFNFTMLKSTSRVVLEVRSFSLESLNADWQTKLQNEHLSSY